MKSIEKNSAYFPFVEDFKDKNGIEVGGPSAMFEHTFPIYQIVNSLDNINFSSSTLWEKELSHNSRYSYFESKPGTQFIAEATDLQGIPATYEFIISSNCLEHIANPIKAILEWKRLLKPKGFLFIVVPWKEANFDHKRDFTEFQHILDDFNNETGEDDLTHLDEILEFHDLTRDIPAGSPEQFKTRCLNNFNVRGMHHHVFSLDVLKEIVSFCQLTFIFSGRNESDLFIYAQKVN